MITRWWKSVLETPVGRRLREFWAGDFLWQKVFSSVDVWINHYWNATLETIVIFKTTWSMFGDLQEGTRTVLNDNMLFPWCEQVYPYGSTSFNTVSPHLHICNNVRLFTRMNFAGAWYRCLFFIAQPFIAAVESNPKSIDLSALQPTRHSQVTKFGEKLIQEIKRHTTSKSLRRRLIDIRDDNNCGWNLGCVIAVSKVLQYSHTWDFLD